MSRATASLSVKQFKCHNPEQVTCSYSTKPQYGRPWLTGFNIALCHPENNKSDNTACHTTCHSKTHHLLPLATQPAIQSAAQPTTTCHTTYHHLPHHLSHHLLHHLLQHLPFVQLELVCQLLPLCGVDVLLALEDRLKLPCLLPREPNLPSSPP